MAGGLEQGGALLEDPLEVGDGAGQPGRAQHEQVVEEAAPVAGVALDQGEVLGREHDRADQADDVAHPRQCRLVDSSLVRLADIDLDLEHRRTPVLDHRGAHDGLLAPRPGRGGCRRRRGARTAARGSRPPRPGWSCPGRCGRRTPSRRGRAGRRPGRRTGSCAAPGGRRAPRRSLLVARCSPSASGSRRSLRGLSFGHERRPPGQAAPAGPLRLGPAAAALADRPPPPYGQPQPGGYGAARAVRPAAALATASPRPATAHRPGYGAPAGAYFISDMGQEQGPLQVGQLAQMATSGNLKPDTMVRADNGQQWFAAKEVPGLYSDKELVTTAIISWLVGVFGVDRFYLGYTGLGVAKLLTFGGCGDLGDHRPDPDHPAQGPRCPGPPAPLTRLRRGPGRHRRWWRPGPRSRSARPSSSPPTTSTTGRSSARSAGSPGCRAPAAA